MKWLKRLAITILVLYAVACIGLYFFQERIIFLPDRLSENHVYRTGEEVKIDVADGISLSCVWMKEPNSKGVILYLHGNRGSNRRCIYQAENMAGNGYDIFMPDYRGYGKSGGAIQSEQQLFDDVQTVYDFLKQHYDESQIVVVGYSIGSGMASWVAANNTPQQLALLAPYVSLVDIKNRRAPFLPSFLLKYPLRNIQHLEKISCPVNLFHGLQDRIIPFDSSEKLQAVNPSKITLHPLDDCGHRRTIFHHGFRRVMSKLLQD